MVREVKIKDILSEIWRRKIIIICVALLAVICAALRVFVIDKGEDKNINGTNIVYSKTILVNIDAKNKSEYFDIIGQSKSLRDIYASACDSEYFAQYLQDNIKLDNPLSEYLVESKDKEADVVDANVNSILKSLVFDCPKESTSIKLSLDCYDSEIGDEILDLLIPYMKNILQENLGDAKFVEVSRSSYEKSLSVSQTNESKRFIKNAAIFLVAFEFVYFIIMLFEFIIVPKVLNESDLKAYFDAPVWEIK